MSRFPDSLPKTPKQTGTKNAYADRYQKHLRRQVPKTPMQTGTKDAYTDRCAGLCLQVCGALLYLQVCRAMLCLQVFRTNLCLQVCRAMLRLQFDLVCANAWMLDLTQAILNLGFLAGAFTLGYAADRYGRILIYLISCFGVGVTGVVVAFAPNFSVFVIFRFLQGVFGKGAWMTCFVIVTEIVGSKQRRIVGIVIQMFFTLGIILLPGIAYFMPSWQGIQLAISLPSFLFLLYYWVVPESPRWLITRKQGEKALKILRHVAKCKGKYLSPNYSEITVTDEEVSNPSFLDLVRTPQMRKCTLILMFAWFTSAVVYQGLVMRLGIVGGNLYIDFFISGLVELPAALLILLTIERLGRRLPFAASNIVAGVACLVTAFLPEGILASICGGLVMLLPETKGIALPETVDDVEKLGRSTGTMSCAELRRVVMVSRGVWLLRAGILASICGGLVMLLPETKGIALPETVDDVEKLGRADEETMTTPKCASVRNYREDGTASEYGPP
ncbi:Solute carrier family 22 member 3 [Microtus ochrogaster]|uniref:Solute carrier family 22 member 3 n=1 Tax=Microtus ochrogaster TaxID=79684 RepID=A0A8J6GZQ0_MICOH|nr:Solute carrier family 22 member 3 [Microtus ochrogaster]